MSNDTDTTEAPEVTDEDTTPEAVEEAAPADDTAPTEDTEPDAEADDDGKEAAKYRRKLREAEKQRDELAARVEGLQRQQAEALLGSSNVKPAALWAVTELAELLGDDGSVDPDKLTAAVGLAREKFGIAKLAKGNIVPGVGNRPSQMPKGDAWTEAFTPSRRR